MAFTYATDLSTDLALVRFHIGDTNEKGAYLSDEEIEYWITEEDSVGGAAIACIKYIITQLSTEKFTKDWLSVDPESAREGYEKLLKTKAQEFGVSISGAVVAATVANPYRADSKQTTSTYDGT